MLGMCLTLKDFMQRLGTSEGGDAFVSYKTSKTKVHYYETPTGVAFVLTTDPLVGDIRNILQELHKSVSCFIALGIYSVQITICVILRVAM